MTDGLVRKKVCLLSVIHLGWNATKRVFFRQTAQIFELDVTMYSYGFICMNLQVYTTVKPIFLGIYHFVRNIIKKQSENFVFYWYKVVSFKLMDKSFFHLYCVCYHSQNESNIVCPYLLPNAAVRKHLMCQIRQRSFWE